MLRLPDSHWGQTEVLANWVELCALVEDDGFVARGQVLDTLVDSNLFGNGGTDSTNESSASAKTADIWWTLQRRQRLLDSSWPYVLTDESLMRRDGYRKLEEVASYATMLLIEASAMGWFRNLTMKKNDAVRTLFEGIVTSSLGRLCGGQASRFGAPFPAAWPKGFSARVKHLAGIFGLSSNDDEVTKLTSPKQQDGSLDIVARWRIGDEDAASAYLLVQCATAKKWRREKLGEPKMAMWGKLVSWNGPAFRVIAVPFSVRGKGELYSASVDYEWAIILDRFRIACGDPDKAIDAGLRAALVVWCRRKFAALPAHTA
jgi:hypothetical protein